MEVELEQLVGKRLERAPKTWTSWIFLQVTKDKMLAEKDEELRRMQEMLAQMQVTSEILWTLMDVQQFQTVFVWYFSISGPKYSQPYLYPIFPYLDQFFQAVSVS